MMNNVHQVAVKKSRAAGGEDWTMMSRDAFLNMDGSAQINLVLDGDVKFYDASGDNIPLKEAVSSIGLM